MPVVSYMVDPNAFIYEYDAEAEMLMDRVSCSTFLEVMEGVHA